MKILMINKFLYPRGGCETYMLALGNHLAKLGHEVSYFGMYDEKNTVGNKLGLYTQNMDFHSKGLERILYPFKIIYSHEAEKKLGKVLDDFKPDIVHMNNINFQLTPSVIYAVKKRNIPLVQTVHDYQMICPNHLLYNFEKNEICEKCLSGSYAGCLKNKCIHGSSAKSLIGMLEAKLYSRLGTYKKVDLYICPSHFLADKLTGTKSFYKDKTYTIHNFIDKKKFDQKNTEKQNYILFAGRLSAEKGVESLAKIAEALPEYKFRIAGNGPDENVLKNTDNVEMLGFLTGEKLTEVMGNAKLMILPSVWYENCPLSILESISMGVPVITMNSGGMAELVRDGETGILINSPEDAIEKIKTVMENKDYYDKLSDNCRKERENILDIDSYCNILLQKYNSIINRR